VEGAGLGVARIVFVVFSVAIYQTYFKSKRGNKDTFKSRRDFSYDLATEQPVTAVPAYSGGLLSIKDMQTAL